LTKDISNKSFSVDPLFTFSGMYNHTEPAVAYSRLSSLFMLSLAHFDQYYQILLAQGVGMGIGSGIIYVASLAIQVHHWTVRRSLAMGVVVTGKFAM
jgi:hypothetical protein